MVTIRFPAASFTGHLAGALGPAVDMDGAGAAQPFAAAEFRAREEQFLSYYPEERRIGVDVESVPLAVDR